MLICIYSHKKNVKTKCVSFPEEQST